MPLPTSEYLSAAVQDAIQDMSAASERSLQSISGQIGVSDVGHCREYVRRTLVGEAFTDPRDQTLSWLGTAIGDHLEEAFIRKFTNARRHVEVTTHLRGRAHEYILTGHPDILLPDGVIDGKSVNGLETVRRDGPSLQQEFQLHLYALGAHQMGLFREGLKLEEIWVADVWIDRSGRSKHPYSNPHMLDPMILAQAAEWLDDAAYAFEHKEEASRDKHIEWCADYCERYTACRMGHRDVSGVIAAPHLVSAVKLLKDGRERAKEADQWVDEAKAVLLEHVELGQEGLAGTTTDGIPVRITWVNGSPKRVGFHRINIG